MENNSHYLSNVKLSGYKSIIDVDVSLKDGLNIIIGKNAAGKTNFLTFLNEVLDFSFDGLINFSSEMRFKGKSYISIKSKRTIAEEDIKNIHRISKSYVETKIEVYNNVIFQDSDLEILNEVINKESLYIYPTFVKHGLPKEYYLVDSSFSFKVDSEGYSEDLVSKVLSPNTPYFIRSLLASLIFFLIKGKDASVKKVETSFHDFFKELEEVSCLLNMYSPIEKIKFNENFNFFLDEETNEYTINNLFIEFNVQGSWIPFNNLSDGTKRLFYIITEIGFNGVVHFDNDRHGYHNANRHRTILIEEPELGVHPHQLMALMNFLKAESHNKQIIVTSHSPIALDVLDENELDRIIIAYSENRKEGTQLRHLENDEKEKAIAYLENDYLSDYWKYSDLEK